MREVFGEFIPLPKKTLLKKNKIMNTIVHFYNKIEFPDCIYIALIDSYKFGKGSVVSLIGDYESFYENMPLARIDKLILNIPSKEEYKSYFQQVFNINDPRNITIEMEKKFWLNYSWTFAEEASGIKLEWE